MNLQIDDLIVESIYLCYYNKKYYYKNNKIYFEHRIVTLVLIKSRSQNFFKLLQLTIIAFLPLISYADTILNVDIKVNTNRIEKKLTFTKDNYYSVTFNYDFKANGIDYVKSVSVTNDLLPLEYLKVRMNHYGKTITVILNYPDPFFSPINYEVVDFNVIRLLLDNETSLFIKPLLLGLAKHIRIKLLEKIYLHLNNNQYIEYEDELMIGIIEVSQASKSAAYNLWKVLFEEKEKNSSKLEIVKMVLGYASVDEIEKMKLFIAQDEALLQFTKLLAQNFKQNEILHFLSTI